MFAQHPDKVAVGTRVTGKHTGNFFIIPPSGNKIDYQAVHIFGIGDDGNIVEHKAVRDFILVDYAVRSCRYKGGSV